MFQLAFDTTSIVLVLPYPPSTNMMWRRHERKTLLSVKGRKFRRDVYGHVLEQLNIPPQLEGRLAVDVLLNPPDRRQRDIDNCAKSLLDSLTHAKVWKDDVQVDILTLRRGMVHKPGSCTVTIHTLSPEDLSDEMLLLWSGHPRNPDP